MSDPDEKLFGIYLEAMGMKRAAAVDPWALLWSRSQGCLHKEPLSDAMVTGMGMLMGNMDHNDFILLYVGPEKAIHAMAKSLQPQVEARAAADSLLGIREGR